MNFLKHNLPVQLVLPVENTTFELTWQQLGGGPLKLELDQPLSIHEEPRRLKGFCIINNPQQPDKPSITLFV